MKVKRAGKSCRQAPTGWARPWSIRPRPPTVKKKIAKKTTNKTKTPKFGTRETSVHYTKRQNVSYHYLV